jgi:hypothetical protein
MIKIFLPLIVLLLLSGVTLGCECNGSSLSWMIGQNVIFESPDHNRYGGYYTNYEGIVLDTYYGAILIQYQNGERHWIYESKLIEFPNLEKV